jgi:hypothetical protein
MDVGFTCNFISGLWLVGRDIDRLVYTIFYPSGGYRAGFPLVSRGSKMARRDGWWIATGHWHYAKMDVDLANRESELGMTILGHGPRQAGDCSGGSAK